MANKKYKVNKNKKVTAQPAVSQEKKTASQSIKKTSGSPAVIKSYLQRPLLPGNWKMHAGIFILFILATQLIYLGDLHLGFFSVDDEGYVIKNPWITKVNFENISHLLTTPFFLNFSPVHIFSYMFDYAIAGADPFTFHLSSNIWAGLVAGFVYLTALALTGRQLIAVLSALLFVVHPVHVEAVAWISSRKDLVAAAFALPSLIAYLKYRKGGNKVRRWYILSILLYLFAVAGKVSVAVFPAIYFALDIFIEKRDFKNSIIDKIPYAFATAVITYVVYKTQPLSGNAPDPYVFLHSLSQSLWLLTGFGDYVIYRLRPDPVSTGLEIISAIILLTVLIVPFLFRRPLPLAAALIYWVLLGWLPSQVLSFVHPVTDRYLFFPSVAFVMLASIGINTILERMMNKGRNISVALLLILAFFWSRATLNYLSEWQDPRSIWFSAMKKSVDPDVPYSLGGYYSTIAGQLGLTPRGERLESKKAIEIASALWADNPRLKDLLAEWQENKKDGPAEKEFQNYLWTQSLDLFNKAEQTIGTHVFPTLYYRRGIVLLDKGDLKGARNAFLASLKEVSLSTVEETKEEITVSSHNALGAIAWRENNYKEALSWYQLAENEQTKFGGNWVPDIKTNREKMEMMVSTMGEGGDKTKITDPELAYNLGMHYLDMSDKLGTNPRIRSFSIEEFEPLANEVWKDNPQLPQLLAEWKNGQHGSITEKAFQTRLRQLCLETFDHALRIKGNKAMPKLFYRKGMAVGESGDLNGAKKEFLAAIEEAAHAENNSATQEIIVLSHDGLGVAEWYMGNYKEALKWFTLAEEKQKQFGGNWVPDIASKKQQMEAKLK